MDPPLSVIGTSLDVPKIYLFPFQHCKGTRRRKRGRKSRRNRSESPSQYLRKVKQNKKKNALKVKMSDQCLDSIVQDFWGDEISLMNVNSHNNSLESGDARSNLCEQTIDLCDGSSHTSDSLHSSDAAVPSLNDKPSSIALVDLSDDLPKQKEVIDLTETLNVPDNPPRPMTSPQPNVIDISDETPKEVNSKSDNDEISVIGTFTRTCHLKKESPSFIPLTSNWNSLITCSEKLKKKYLRKHSVLDGIDYKAKQVKKHPQQLQKSHNKVGANVYVNSPVPLPSQGLRPIIIDGSNVAFVHSKYNFSCKRLEICINYFKEKGHKVTAFVPQFRLSIHKNDDPELLRKLEKQGDVVLTPSKKIDGRNIVPYDDRYKGFGKGAEIFILKAVALNTQKELFIVQTAVLQGGIIITRDNYNDLLKENPAWAETIKYRTLAFTWVDDVLMFPSDPLGEFGPSLEQFLRFH